MDNLEGKANHNAGPPGKDHQSPPDPTVRAGEDPGRPQRTKKPRTMGSAEGSADSASVPGQVMQMRGPMPTVLSAHDVVELMLRYKRTILIVFVLVAAPAIAAIWTQVVPKYRAQAQVRVRPIIPYLVFKTEDSGSIPLYDSYVNTQVSIMSGVAVLQRVLDQQEVQQTQWYTNPPKSFVQRLRGNPPAARDRLRDSLSAKPRKATEIIDVTFTDSRATDAQIIVNTLLDQYVKYVAEMSDATQDQLYSQLVEQYRTLENEILGREKLTAELRQRLGTATPEELVSGQRVRLDGAQARLADVKQNIALLNWEIARATAVDANDTSAAEVTEEQLRYYRDDEWRRLDSSVRGLKHAIETTILAEKHPDAIRAQKDLAFAEESLRLREAQLDEQWREGLKTGTALAAGYGGSNYQDDLLSLKHQLERSQYEEQLLDAEYKAQQKAFDDLFGNAQLLEKENSALSHKRTLFDAVRQRLDQKNMERNVPGSIEVLARAQAPSQPYNDRRVVLTFMMCVLALGLGGGVAFIRDSRNKAIHAPKDLPYPMQVQFLGVIPDTVAAKSSNGQIGQTLIEPTRVIRTALLSRLNGQGCATVLVTSAGAGTGKSSFTLMLGKSLAQTGKKVLMIDADFKKMTLTNQFGNLSDQSGFIQSLSCGSVYKRHIFETQTPGLNIVPAGKRGDGEVALEGIANGAFSACIDKLRRQYDVILLDSPPILPLADATILSSQVDGTIMVERELISRRSDVISALSRLASADARLLGTVFVGSGSHEKYGY